MFLLASYTWWLEIRRRYDWHFRPKATMFSIETLGQATLQVFLDA